MPVARFARPLPSTLTERAICVSVVLRSALAARVDIAEGFSTIAYTKSASASASAARQRRFSSGVPMVSRTHWSSSSGTLPCMLLISTPATFHSLEDPCRVGHTQENEIRVARENSDAGKLAKLGGQSLSLGDDVARLGLELSVVGQRPARLRSASAR